MIILIAVFRFTAVEAKEVLNLLMGQYGHTACFGEAGRPVATTFVKSL